MKIAIVSDTHFGYAWESERADDSFEAAHEAFQRTRDADLVILPGDIYDHKVPKQEVLGRSIDCFNEYRRGDCNLTFTAESDVTHDFTGTPVVAIHGTHERRMKGFTNPIELLEKMGYLLHLHNETAVLQNAEGETVAVHGMSGVPERYAPGVLEKFAPEPVADAYNIFVFHQSVEKFVYTSTDHAHLKLEHLPEGFDLLVDGHIHWYDLSNVGKNKPLILPGSTVSTQMRKVEAEKSKGFVTVDTATDEVQFHELENQRDLFYEEIDVSDMSSADILNTVDDRMNDIIDGNGKKPLVRLILTGKTDASLKLAEIRKRYRDDVVLSLSKRFTRSSQSVSPEAFQESTKTVAERGQEMLRSKLESDSLQVENLFELLAEEQRDEAVAFVEELNLTDDMEDRPPLEGQEEKTTDSDAPKEACADGTDEDVDLQKPANQDIENVEEDIVPPDNADRDGTKTLDDFA